MVISVHLWGGAHLLPAPTKKEGEEGMRYTTMGLRYFGVLLVLVAAAALMAVGLLALVGTKPAEAAFPGNNGKVAFTSSRDFNNLEIYSMDPNGSNQTNLTNLNPGTNSGASDFQASFNHDGTRIAFATNRNGNTEIYVMDDTGSNPTRLTTNAADDGNPAFSPDGKIAFQTNRDGDFEIYVMDATDSDADGNGDNLKRLTTNPALDVAPAFSPNGTKIAFETNRDGLSNRNIYLMKAVDSDNDGNGDDLKRLTKNLANDTLPSFSPGGTKIAFTSERAGNNEVYVMKPRPEGRKNRPKNLTKNAASDRNPAFSPNGTMIAFSTNRDGNDEIYRMKADGTSQTRLTTNTASDIEPDWGVFAP
jgi:Tol biopolymer transport system component